jgi:GT2 family glycosyltransferase
MPSPLVISVVLNTNHREDTLQCLTSLNQNTYENHEIILLDNASSDGTVDAVRSSLPDVQIIELQKNLGYAGNNNVGIQVAMEQGADWVFVLNEDTILSPDCISHLVSVGESDPTIGIVGPMVYHHNEPDVIQSAGGLMDKYYRGWHLGQDEKDQGQFQQPHQVEWISGCGIMVRRAVIDQIGGIDERFFYYVEEFEWCVRARKTGWQIIHVPQAKLWHKGVQRNNQPKPSVTYYATRNQLLLLLKHRATPIVWIVTLSQFLRTLTSWTIKPKWRSKHEHRNAMWHGIVDFLHHRWGQMAQKIG